MGRGKRPVRGGKRKLDRHNERRPKSKKGKFNFWEASYVKERDTKNKEIEHRRQMLEKEKARRQELETDSSEDEEVDHMKFLLATFSNTDTLQKPEIVSSSESDRLSEEENSKDDNNDSDNDIDCETQDSSHYLEQNKEHISEDDNDEITIQLDEDEEDIETACEDTDQLKDPFSIHLYDDLDDALYTAVSSTPQIMQTHILSWPTLGKLVCQIPKAPKDLETTINPSGSSILEEKRYAKHASLPILMNSVDWNKLSVKSQIQSNLNRALSQSSKGMKSNSNNSLTPLQQELFSVINNYQDLLYTERTFSNADEIRFIYCLHVINHVLKTRTKILHHNAKIVKSKSVDVPDEYRDQGLVRPKVLIIVPFKHSCLKIVESLISILIGEDKGGSVMNKKKIHGRF